MPIKDYFIFDGKKSTDYGLYMASDPQAIHPARRGETFPIPGRNGVIVREDGSYDTYTLTYDMMLDSNTVARDVYDHARKVAALLLGSRGFCRLEDSYEPEYFRLARCAEQMNVENRLMRFGRAQIPFEVQPQRYLKDGEMVFTLGGSGTTGYDIRIENLPSWVKKVSMDYSVGMAGSNTLRLVNVNDPSDSIRAEEEEKSGYYIQVLDVTDVYRVVAVSGITNSPQKAISFYDEDGNQTVVLVKNGGNNAYMIYNPTEFSAQPLIEILDKAGTPTNRELTSVQSTMITGGGNVINYEGDGVYTTQPTTVPTNGYVYITGTGYTFLDSTGTTPPAAQYAYGKPVAFKRGTFAYQKLPVPAGADTLVIMGTDETPAALSVQSDRSQVGSYALTVGSTSVSVDLTQQDDVILDCDLHDARYVDGSNANQAVVFSDPTSEYPTFPSLGSGATDIIVSGDPSIAVRIIPRWWTL